GYWLQFGGRYADLGSTFAGEFGCRRQFAADDRDHALHTLLSVIVQKMAAGDPGGVLTANEGQWSHPRECVTNIIGGDSCSREEGMHGVEQVLDFVGRRLCLARV